MSVVIVNPLAGALRHYTDALQTNLGGVDRIDLEEPSLSGTGRRLWLIRYVRALRTAARRAGRGGTIVITWPIVGYLDLLLALVVPRAVRVLLVMHDPEPLVHAVGHGRWSRLLAHRLGRRATVVAHGSDALAVITTQGFGQETVVLPHPVLPSSLEAHRGSVMSPAVRRVAGPVLLAYACRSGGSAPFPPTAKPVIRVVGQWKPDRDVALLAALAPILCGRFDLQIAGRGWPSIAGWDVRDAFLAEAELDDMIADAALVLIPYRRFFQSGVAIRSLEIGTPFVGPNVAALADIAGTSQHVLVERDAAVAEWVRAIDVAVVADRLELRRRAAYAAMRAERAWTFELDRGAAR